MNLMTETELRQLLETNGFNLNIRKRTGVRRSADYLIARNKKAPYQTVHIASRRQLPIVSQEEVLSKIGVAS